jgi:phosphate starvation-inducible PhoH-like protein
MTSLSSDFQSRIIIPNSISMISLLGTNDENLRIVEKSFPEVNLHVRGNEINLY